MSRATPARPRTGLRACVLAAVCTAAAFAQERPVLQIVAEHYPPFEFLRDGRAAGIDVEVTARILERLGVPFEFRAGYPFTRVWLMLRKGSADAAPSISHQEVREPVLYFTDSQRAFNATGRMPRDYLWVTEYVFFVARRLADAVTFDSYEQLGRAGYRIGVNREYTYDEAFRNASLNRREFVTPNEALRALAAGEIDLFPMDRTVGQWLLNDLGLAGAITTLPKPLFAKPYLMVFSRASPYPGLPDLMRRYYAELQALRDSGEYRQIYNRYVPPAYPAALPRPVVFVCEEWSPFEYLEDGRPRGIDVDVVDRIMRRLGIPYRIEIYPWSRAWMLVEKGRADAVLSVSYKADREPVLFYTPEQRAFAATGRLPADYLWVSDYVFFIKRSRAASLRFESYGQLKADGVRVGTNKGYSYDPAFLRAALSCREYPDTRAALHALVEEEIDLYPIDRTVGLAELARLGLAGSVTFLDRPLFTKPYLAPFSKLSDLPGLEPMMHAFYGELRLMRQTGEIDEITSRYAPRAGDAKP